MFSLCAINREAHMKFEHIKDFVKEKKIRDFKKAIEELEFADIAIIIDELEDDYETQTYTRECEYTILRIAKNTIVQEKCGVIKDTELYDLLYSSDLSLSFIFNIFKNDDLTDKEEYWRNIPRNENSERFWFPLYSDFKYLSDNYDGNIDKQINEWDDNWDYYNDNLDMDQQSPEFWNF